MIDNYRIIFDIHWEHQKVIISKAQNIEEALFYTHQTLSNGWSRSVLENRLKQQFYEHYGQVQTNFSQTLPALTADIPKARERDIEKQLVTHIKSFMAENAVFLLFTALIHNFYKTIMQYKGMKEFVLRETSRIKAFVFKFISVPAKWMKKARQDVLNIYTENKAYTEIFKIEFG